MNETLKSLYDRFYTSLPLGQYEQEVESCHHQLIKRQEKPERTIPGQFPPRIPSGVGTGRRIESLPRKQASVIS